MTPTSMTRFLCLALVAVPTAYAVAQAKPKTVEQEIAALKKELADQRALLLMTIRQEQQRYEMILRLLSGGGELSELTKAGKGDAAAALEAEASETGEKPTTTARRTPRPPPTAPTGTIEGTVILKGRKAPAYVYVENAGGGYAKGTSFEIKQENKQFWPRAAVVQRGTRVSFPNVDAIFHNVFSVSPGNTFDLGSYRAGDKARSVVLTKPGKVEIFCNMHSKMSATVLVVSSGYIARVEDDGSFKLTNVPVGARKIVAWSPNAKMVSEQVQVAANASASANLTLDVEGGETTAHVNKFGQPYGSYDE